MAFMRRSQYWNDWNERPSINQLVFRFEPLSDQDAARQFLAGLSDPFTTLVGVVGEVAFGQWLEARSVTGFEQLWECKGSGMEQWQRAHDIKRAYEDAKEIRECLSTQNPSSIKPLRL